jgi:arabinofuranosyltransferase
VSAPPRSGITPGERLALVAGLLLASALMWPLRGYLTDDTFIHLQVARHLAEGHGPVFNVGERVYGSTSPLWVALLGGAMAIGRDGLASAKAIGVIATLASILLFFQLLRHTVRTPSLRAAATLVWAGHAWMMRW